MSSFDEFLSSLKNFIKFFKEHNENVSSEMQSNYHSLCLAICDLTSSVKLQEINNRVCLDNFLDSLKFYEDVFYDQDKVFIDTFDYYFERTLELSLADACIKLIELGIRLGINFDDYDFEGQDLDIYNDRSYPESVFYIVSEINSYKDSLLDGIPAILCELFSMAKSINLDLPKVVSLTMHYYMLVLK